MSSTIHDLCESIVSKRHARYESERRVYRQDHPRASSIGDCARAIFYDITQWQQRPPPNPELLQRFQRGHDVERVVNRELLADGWNVIEQQMPFEIVEPYAHWGRAFGFDVGAKEPELIICTGHVDGRIEWNGLNPVVEIKSLNANVWGRIETAEDFKRMGSFWTRYPRQLLLYCYANNEPFGLFLLDDCLGHWKAISMILDEWLDECEAALVTARTAAIAAITGEPPPFCQNPLVCKDCWCKREGVCFPSLDFSETAINVIEDAEFADSLAQLAGLASCHQEYARLDKPFKDRMKLTGPGQYIVGDYLVTVKKHKNSTRTTYERLHPQPTETPA